MPAIKIVELNGEVVFQPDDLRHHSWRRPQQERSIDSAVGRRAMRDSRGATSVRTWSLIGWCCVTAIAMGLPIDRARAEELAPLPICSALTGALYGLQNTCRVTTNANGRRKVKIDLTAQTGKILGGGYTVETEHYNDSYLAPVVEAMPGDIVAARLVNRLTARPPSDGHAGHGPANENPTNLHSFHGGIVTPKNARPPEDAGKGNGDNIFVYLKNGTGNDESGFSFEYEVPIPGKEGARCSRSGKG